ncbi:uncharacterized protein LOC108630560 isoform X2 [Ceratina calcarata]|nr:uncharacterized protein LOC108630560 isoform X2 [Ceratina calcarata]
MHIVEAAGTGTAGRSSSCWKTAADIGMANLMKSELEQFFNYITRPKSSCINIIRSSNLLRILGSAFSLSSVIRFISHVQITREDLDITLSTLKFTAKVARLKPVKVKENIQHRGDLLVHKLQNEVNDLKKELMLNDLFLQQEALVNISKSRLEQINRTILSYLDGKISDFTLISVSQAQALLKTIKDLYDRLTVKEVEVEKMKETYENLMKGAPVVDRSLESDHKDTDDQTTDDNWQRLRSLSQILLEVKPLQQEMGKEEVGSLVERSGITLGPYTNDTTVRTIQTQNIVKIDDQHMGAARHLFNCFLKENIMYTKIKEMFDKSQKALAGVHQKFTNTIDIYFQVKRNLDDACDKLGKHQEIRRVLKLENSDTKLILEMENSIEKDIQCHQKVLNSLKEEMSQVQKEIIELTRRQKETGSKLEAGFKEYCKRKNLLLHYTDKSMKAMLEPADRESLEIIRRKYNKLQRTMLRKAKVDLFRQKS